MENVNTHTWMAYLQYDNVHFHQRQLVAQVAFRAEVAFRAMVPPVVVDVRRFPCTSSVSADP